MTAQLFGVSTQKLCKCESASLYCILANHTYMRSEDWAWEVKAGERGGEGRVGGSQMYMGLVCCMAPAAVVSVGFGDMAQSPSWHCCYHMHALAESQVQVYSRLIGLLSTALSIHRHIMFNSL